MHLANKPMLFRQYEPQYEKTCLWGYRQGPTYINWAVGPQKMARGLKFRIYEEEGLYYLCSENKGTDKLQLICIFVFAKAKSQFSHDAAHIIAVEYKTAYVIQVIIKENNNHFTVKARK